VGIDLDATLQLATAGRYSYAADSAAILPRVYGDFFSSQAIPPDSDDGGFLPAIQIDRTSWVFCLNDAPILSSPAPQIYIGDQLQEPHVYLFAPSIDYEGRGHAIAAIQFLVSPGSDQVSWRGYGTVDAGVVIDNPLSALYDAFRTYGNWTLNDFDLATSYATFRTLTELGAGFSWCFWAQKTYREWLTEILRCYHTNYWETSEGKLAMVLDRSLLGLSVSVLNTIDAQTDLVGTEDDVEFEVDEANIMNTLTVKRRYKWTSNEYTDEPTVDFRPSVGLYGILRGEIELPAVYTDTHGIIWVTAFFHRYGFLPAIVRFLVRGLGYATALPGTEVGFVWPWMGWTQARLLRVLNQEVDPAGMSISFECFDCGRFVTDEVTLPTATINEVRRRIRVPDQTVDLSPPGPASGLTAEGSYRQIVLRWTAPGDLDYSHTEIWASTTNNRASAVLHRNGGHGVPPGGPCEATFAVADNSAYFVWLMTVDRSGNGRNGGSGPTGGNWYPPGPTDGVPAAPTLVPTGGMLERAVSDRYAGSLQIASGNYTGEVPVTSAQLGTLFPQGDIRIVGRVGASIGSLDTMVLKIYRGFVGGQVVGTDYVTNPLTVSAFLDKFCPGEDDSPFWSGVYALTVQSLSQTGGQEQWTISYASLSLYHSKR
jgi:hypothetical protein